MPKPNKIMLTVNSELKASHSLAGFETPHFHLWKVEASFESIFPMKNDRLIDLVFLQTTLNEIFSPIEGKFLNDAFSFQPTSENFCAWIWEALNQKLPDAPLCAVNVTLCDLDGRVSGSARLFS